jgi:hypothetical protein
VKSERSASRQLPHWPRANRPQQLVERQNHLRSLSHWQATYHHVLDWPIPAEGLANFQECLTGHLVLPVGVVGPLSVNLGQYTLTGEGDVQEQARQDDRVFVPLAHTEGGLSASIQRGISAVALAGGVKTYVLADRMTRDSCFVFRSTEEALASVLPLVKEHGAAVIGLCMDSNGIPDTAEKRLAVAAKIIERATHLGIPLEDVIIDPLAMSMGSDSQAGKVVLDTIMLLTEEFGVNISMGASNVSFGIPDRKYINATFLAMAIHAGVTCPITNPLISEIAITVLAADLAMGRDEYAMRWIKAFRKREKEKHTV